MHSGLKRALICTIGDEILIGQILDTNSKWLSEQLTLIGIEVGMSITIPDDPDEITSALKMGFEQFDLLILTGGLGPTKDDITKTTISQFFNDKLVLNEDSLEDVKTIFRKFNVPLLEVNIKQAHIPSRSEALRNQWGTAPGMLFKEDEKMLISLPGVPHEMKNIMTHEGFDKINDFFKPENIIYETIKTVGIGESFLMKKIHSWEESLPENIKLAYLPSPGEVKLRLTSKGEDARKLKVEINDQIQKLKFFAGGYIYGYGRTTLSKAIGETLIKLGKTVSTAESCTGGYLAHLITSEPGSSEYFMGSVIAYSDQAKMDLLGVSSSTLKKYGAVSEEVVKEMARGACQKLKTDFGLSTSGIAGPSGGTPEKPVGTIWVGLSNGKEIRTKKLELSKDRIFNIERTAKMALNQLRLWMEE
jgi:competence/damage-inducible protein CinA-like protein